MATRFIEEATQQLAPVYQQSEQAISSQVPAIQNLYNTLIQGLQQQYQTQLQTGTQGIVEDASARGVLRSTLPVDARQALTGQLSQALLQGRGELESRRAGDIAGINERLGQLRIQKAGGIAELARALESQDLERARFEFQKQQAAAESRRGGGGSEVTLTKNSRGGWEVGGGLDLAGYARATGADLITLLLQGDAEDRQAAKWYLEKINKYGTRDADKYFQELQQDRPTAFYRGG